MWIDRPLFTDNWLYYMYYLMLLNEVQEESQLLTIKDTE